MTDNMRIWDKVSKTNPAYTKKVNQRGGFTAISAQYQIMSATECFGPIGIGWGYETGHPIFSSSMIIVPVTIWHGERSNTFGPIYGCAEMLGNRPDSDAPKKATTDAITKGLSQLGFNADVFLGLFDDNKYVAEVTKEFARAEIDPAQAPKSAQAKRELTWEDVQAKFDAATDVDDLDKRYDWFITNNKIPLAWKLNFDDAYEKRRNDIIEAEAAKA